MGQFYQTTLDYIRKHPQLKKSVIFMTQYFPYITFCLYPCVLVYLYLNKSPYLSAAIYKPLGAFLFVTIFRKLINRPRPYDCMNIEPLVGHKHGESFPSRHTLSAFIIALICFYANIYVGIFALIVAMILSGCRILAGVHFISDVLAGIVIAIVFFII